MNRRHFINRSLASTAALGLGSAIAEESVKTEAETVVKSLFNSLTEAQRKEITFDFDNVLRTKIGNNWHITKPRIGTFLDKDQNAMVKEIFIKAHSEEYAQVVYDQVVDDSGKKGFGDSSIALFGEPDTGKFEFVLTGRHTTRRIDGDSVAGKAFGGPIFYGHAADGFYEGPDHKGNAYWFQAKSANRVFEMLDGKQREAALLSESPDDSASVIKLTRGAAEIPGLAVADMSADQKGEMTQVLSDLLMPFREVDRVESMKLIEKVGVDQLHLSFFSDGDLGNDGVWDNWKLEGPNMVWYFRGDPHVHTWVHISDPDAPRAPRA
ncbi:MAG: DUF3500 domain-containing protein [Verrucomicrobiales bacterium]|nr:DUF3500 domain-containing protein [Verrucomicrobiales bacterium]